MLNKNSYKKGVLWMLMFNVIARGISFILSIILAKNFLPVDTDVYLFVWSLINVVMVIVSAVNLMAAGPEYIRLCETGEHKAAEQLNSALLNIYLVPMLVFSLCALVLPVATYQLISGFNISLLEPAREMLRFSGIWLVLVILNNFLGNILLSRKYFVGSVLGQVFSAVITLAFILLFKESLGILSFFIGQIAGNLVCLAFYVYQLRSRVKERFQLFYFRLPRKVVKELVASLTIATPTLVINFVLVYLLSKLVAGQLSAYNYGSTLSNLPDVLILSQFISVIGVKFSEISANQQRDVLFGALRYFGNHLFFIMSGVAVIITLISPIIIEVFYGRKSLDKTTFDSAVLTLTLISSTMAFKSLDILHNRVFASLQALTDLMKYTVPVKVISIGLLILLSYFFGFRGILVHQLSMPVIMVGVEIFLLSKYIPAPKVRTYTGQIILLTLGGIATYVAGRLLQHYVIGQASATIQIAVILVMVVVLGILFEKAFKVTMLFAMVVKRVNTFLKPTAGAGTSA